MQPHSVRPLLARRSSTLVLPFVLLLVVTACGGPAASAAPSAVSLSSPSAAASAAVAPVCPAPGSSAQVPWWSDRIFYEVFVRSFADSNGDGIGDLRGLTERLDYLNDGDDETSTDLGVTGLWLMPVAESPSYHGYDVTDYEAIEADYGTAADFRAFLSAAHDRGIAVIVDLVLNHTSIEHPWFRDARTPGSARDDWYVWSDTRPPVARSDGSRVWHESGDRFYYAYFWEGMPDLNLSNPAVTDELVDVGRFWLEMGVDGFRVDAARHLIEDGAQLESTQATFEWLADYRESLKTIDPDALVLGEVYDSSSMSSRYVRDGSLDVTFDFGLASSVLTSINSRDAGSVNAALDEVARAYPRGGLATFLTNHDQNRVADQLADDAQAERLASTLLLTGPGVPFIYYGEEIGMSGRKPDERIRTPMRWDSSQPSAGFSSESAWESLSDDAAGTDVATESADDDSLLSWYRRLIALRAGHPAVLEGDLLPLESADRHIAAFLRSIGDDVVLVAANLGTEPVIAPALSLAVGPLCGSPTANALLGPSGALPPTITATGGFTEYVPVERLGPRQALVVELTR